MDVVDSWIDDCINKNEWKNYYDLHIDEVYGETDNKFWLDESFELLKSVQERKIKEDFMVVLNIPLKPIFDYNEKNISIDSLKGEDLSITPPSLYIIMKNWHEWEETIKMSIPMPGYKDFDVYLRIGDPDTDDLYYRFLYVIQKGDGTTV